MRNSIELKRKLKCWEQHALVEKNSLFFFQIHFNQQELVNNVISSVLIALGDIFSAQKLYISCIEDNALCGDSRPLH